MKTIFRLFNLAALMAVIAAGAAVSFAQDPCADTAGQEALSNKVRELYAKTDMPSQAAKIEAGKQYMEKYGACTADAIKEFNAYLTPNLPKWEAAYAKAKEQQEIDALVAKFNTALTAKNWDDVYASGKELLNRRPDEFRAVELVLGTIGLDETANNKNKKWNDDTIKYAKMSIADLESGKTFKTFGVNPGFMYKSKDDALGWMNYTVGYLLYFDKNNKKEALSYLYKASQSTSETRNNPVLYQTIGSYYFDDVRTLANEVQELIKAQDPNATPEIQKQQVDAIKAKVAMVNGTSEAAIDAYARAYLIAKKDTKKFPATYTDSLYKTLQDLYNVRFGKTEGVDAWIAGVERKPMPNPLLPVTPISDPDPTAPADSTSGSTTAPATTPATTKPAPAAAPKTDTAPAKPAAKPVAGKPQSGMKKTSKKRSA